MKAQNYMYCTPTCTVLLHQMHHYSKSTGVKKGPLPSSNPTQKLSIVRAKRAKLWATKQHWIYILRGEKAQQKFG